MAKFNPFAKTKTDPQPTEIIEEVELMPDDSVAYFEEKLEEKEQNSAALLRNVTEKRNELKAIGANLEQEKAQRQNKKAEIQLKIKDLKEKQRQVAQQIALDQGDSQALENQLRELSIEIVSEEAKVSVYEDDITHFLPAGIKAELKAKMKNYEQAIEEYQTATRSGDLLAEIKEIIQALQVLEKKISNSMDVNGYIETPDKIISSYLKYFVSQKDLETVQAQQEQHKLENYFNVWLKNDTTQGFVEYAQYLDRL